MSPRWQHQLIDVTALTKALEGNPYLNLGLRLGVQPNGLTLTGLDVDGEKGEATLEELSEELGVLPETLEAVSPGGGRHLYFIVPTSPPNAVSLGHPNSGLDVRSEGGQLVAAPSEHVSGGKYAWTRCRAPAQLPEKWLGRLLEARRGTAVHKPELAAGDPVDLPRFGANAYAHTALEREVAKVIGAPEGQRHRTLYDAAYSLGRLVAGGELPESVIWDELSRAGEAAGIPVKDLPHQIRSGLTRSEERPRQAPPRLAASPAPPTATPALEQAQSRLVGAPPPADPWHLVGTRAVLEDPLPAPRWACKGLDLLPGRPTGLWGKPGSGKTETSQALALAIATGGKAFEALDCEPGKVVHLSYDFGQWAVATRYRRLANGYGLNLDQFADRLHVSAFPDAYLHSPGVEGLLVELTQGARLLVVDCLRDALPGVEENDSGIAQWLKILARVSEQSGVCALYLHHHKKGADAEDIDGGRGSGAIAAASGAVWTLEGQGHEPRCLRHIRPSDASSGLREPLWLVREGWPEPERPFPCIYPAVRIVARNAQRMAQLAQEERTEQAGPIVRSFEEHLLEVVRQYPGQTRRRLRELARESGLKGSQARIVGGIAELVERGEVTEREVLRESGQLVSGLYIAARADELQEDWKE